MSVSICVNVCMCVCVSECVFMCACVSFEGVFMYTINVKGFLN